MMRCLGWDLGYIIVVTTLKTIIFQIIPGVISGLILAFYVKEQLLVITKEQTMFDLSLDLTAHTLWVAIFCATLLPFAAIVTPVYESMSV